MNFYSPLRYPGGKGKVADYFKQIFKDNLLYDGVYVEPFAGGASVALSLLFNEYASRIIINDIDRSIYAFWDSVLNATDQICKLISDTEVTVENWEIQRQIQKTKGQQSLIDVGFSTFYLNRTNRSGILSAGIIGGRQQTGNWKIDARYNKKDLINRIERIANYKNKIELHNSDAVKLVKDLSKILPQKSLFYFDPPYFVKGKDLYLNYYNGHDHTEIANEINKVKNQKWIVTYDDVLPIRDLYTKYRQKPFSLNYSAGSSSKQGKEIMIFSNNVYIAEHKILS
ncbi:MAG: class adenine-specific methyltransferase [Segetibacter sp.]|nr:class adenine-specific methyltransferase [Segetibacter sp.]